MENFWVNFWANLTADMIVALVVGVVLVLYINSRQEKTQNRMAQNQILSIIKFELERNIELSKQTIKSNKSNKRLPQPGLKHEIWDFYVNSGELSWLTDNLPLLHALSIGYHSIKSINRLEANYIMAWTHYEDTGRKGILDRICNDLTRGHQDFFEAAENFLEQNDRMKGIDTSEFNAPDHSDTV